MERLIDASAIRRQIVSRQTTLYFFNNEVRHEIGCIVEMVDNAPTIDAVPVVRCKDCLMQRMCKVAQWLGEDGYCSAGGRRSE